MNWYTDLTQSTSKSQQALFAGNCEGNNLNIFSHLSTKVSQTTLGLVVTLHAMWSRLNVPEPLTVGSLLTKDKITIVCACVCMCVFVCMSTTKGYDTLEPSQVCRGTFTSQRYFYLRKLQMLVLRSKGPGSLTSNTWLSSQVFWLHKIVSWTTLVVRMKKNRWFSETLKGVVLVIYCGIT